MNKVIGASAAFLESALVAQAGSSSDKQSSRREKLVVRASNDNNDNNSCEPCKMTSTQICPQVFCSLVALCHYGASALPWPMLLLWIFRCVTANTSPIVPHTSLFTPHSACSAPRRCSTVRLNRAPHYSQTRAYATFINRAVCSR